MDSGRLPKQHQDYTISPGRAVGDFRFIVLEERVANPIHIKPFEHWILQTKAMVKRLTATPIRWFGLQFSESSTEVVPLVLSDVTNLPIHEREAEV